MSPSDPPGDGPVDDDLDHLDDWERHLCAPLTGRKIICAFEVLAGMTTQVQQLRRWRAQRPLLLGDGLGTGPVPLETDAEIVVLEEPTATTLTEQVRARITTSRNPGPAMVRAVETYDPQGAAAWWVSPTSPNEPLLDRPVLGGRPSWQIALEDKLALDPIVRAVGAPPAPAEISTASYDALVAASSRVAETAGSASVVWAGDARDGVNGGGDYLRIVANPEHARSAAEFFAAHCDHVRVSPLLDGVPCSIHGLVLPDGVLVLRPVELFTLRNAATGRFFYGGMGTSWDPPAADGEEMRRLADDIGHHLGEQYGLRGAFGLDGVLTADGFRLTEMNPRFSGGLTRLSNAAPELHLELVQLNAMIGRDIGRSAADLQAEAMETLDAHRIVDCMGLSTHLKTTSTSYQRVRTVEGAHGSARTQQPELVPAADEEIAVGTVLRGSASMGTFVRLTVDERVVRPGTRGAPLSVAMLDFADRRWGTGFGALTMPTDVRGR